MMEKNIEKKVYVCVCVCVCVYESLLYRSSHSIVNHLCFN